MKRMTFVSPVALMLGLLHVYIGLRLLLPFGPVVESIGIAALAACFALLPKGWQSREHGGRWQVLMPWITMGFFSWLLVLTVLRDASLIVTSFALPIPDHASWVRLSAAGVMILTPAITLAGFVMARRVARIAHVEVRVPGLHPALEGFTIAQISDIHVGPTIKRDFVQAIVERVNRLQADMVAITGDIVDGSVHDLAHHTEPLAGLASRHGTYVVTGNHEYYSGVHGWVRELQRLGARVLLNEHVVLDHDGASLALAGVTDYAAHHFDASHRSDPHGAIAGAPQGALKVLLAHQPRSAHAAAEAGYDLQLSGHTHGGQFWPWNHFVRLQQPFTAGLKRLGAMWIYISRGTGYWGPPMRFFIPSEITRIRLVGD